MKKLFLLLMSLCSLGAHADEGMWTLFDLPAAIYDQMKQYGFQLPQEQLYQSDNAVKNAVVNFGGFCSGVVVSSDGLVFTNHHCGFDAIRQHSTVEHDYLLNGFYAKSYEEELPNEGLFVSFMVEQKDVSDQILPLLKGIKTDRQAEVVDSIENAWQKDIRQQDSTLRVELKPFYEGNKFYCTTYRDFNEYAWCSPYPSRWVSLVVRPTTGCGPDRRATTLFSASMPTPRPTVLPNTRRITYLIIQSRGLPSLCRAISLATSV